MSIVTVSILFFVCLIFFLVLGLPIAFSLGGTAMLFCLFLWGPSALYQIASSAWGVANDWLLLCIPLFIYMGIVLQNSGVADDLYTMMHYWMGPVRGGLAIGTVIICTIFAAMAGISGAACVTLGLIALPSMLKRGYDKYMALGSIASGAALGILIPPSLIFILYSSISGVSVGKLFAGGVFPGLLLAGLFIIYIFVRCLLNPELGPTLPLAERADWKKKIGSLKAVILPFGIIIGVLGSIYTGAATPTEAAAVGAIGAMISSIINGRFKWANIKLSVIQTFQVSAMIMWIVIGAACYCGVYSAIGGSEFVEKLLLSLPVGRYWILVGIMMIIFFLGMFIDPAGIVMIATPIFVTVMKTLNFDLLWFGVLFCMNLEMAYLTPPLGLNLFYLKGVSPPEITMGDITNSIWPFVGLQAIGLALVIVFPEIGTWLPSFIKG